MLHKQEGLDDIGAMARLQAGPGGTLTSWRPSGEGRMTEGCRGGPVLWGPSQEWHLIVVPGGRDLSAGMFLSDALR